MQEILTGALALFVLVGLIWLVVMTLRVNALARILPERQAQMLEEKHRAMLADLHEGLARLGDRLGAAQADNAERLRASVAEELRQTREALQSLQLAQSRELGQSREAMAKQLGELALSMQEKLAEQGRADQELIQNTMRGATQQITASMERLTGTVGERLEQISGRVAERLDEGFKKTNETFASVMARLATIDEAQKKIDGLTSNVVSLQELLGDKRSRGAFGEVQLEALVKNILPANAYTMQHTLSNGSRADCVLMLPEPTGMVAVDSKFPLENFRRMLDGEAGAEKQFRADVKKHVDDIAAKYIIPNETSDGAVMFVPAEAVFAEIHAHHAEVVAHAQQKRVWIVSPTTLMAVLNTARAVLRDVETRKQVHIIKDELTKLGKDFARFDARMKKLADHIRQAHEDAEDVHKSSTKITRRFQQIEHVELEHLADSRLLETDEE
ncbi:MAG: DNA recombination protein RmuC [Pseudomonadota bacterium]